jgi:hypothetical protein
MFRAFDQICTRELVQLEVEITEIEKEMESRDRKDEANPKLRDRLQSTTQNEKYSTRALLRDRQMAKLNQYCKGHKWNPRQRGRRVTNWKIDDLFLKHVEIRNLCKPTQRDYRSLYNWIFNEKPLKAGYYDFIKHEDDFVIPRKRSGQGDISATANQFEKFIRSYAIYWFPFLKVCGRRLYRLDLC